MSRKIVFYHALFLWPLVEPKLLTKAWPFAVLSGSIYNNIMDQTGINNYTFSKNMPDIIEKAKSLEPQYRGFKRG